MACRLADLMHITSKGPSWYLDEEEHLRWPHGTEILQEALLIRLVISLQPQGCLQALSCSLDPRPLAQQAAKLLAEILRTRVWSC